MFLMNDLIISECNEVHLFLDSVALSWGISLASERCRRIRWVLSLTVSDTTRRPSPAQSTGLQGEYHTCRARFPFRQRNRRTSSSKALAFKIWIRISAQPGGTNATPPSNFEMRPRRPRGLSVARCGLTALRDISRDPSPSVRVYLSVSVPVSVSHSLNIEDSFISGNPLFFC